MESGKLNYNGIIYMTHPTKNKFWEVRNQGSLNRFRFGKLRNGSEYDISSGNSQYSNPALAIERAEILMMDKKDRGYELHNNQRPSIISDVTSPKPKKSPLPAKHMPFRPAPIYQRAKLAPSNSSPNAETDVESPIVHIDSSPITTYSLTSSVSLPTPPKEKILKEISIQKSDKKNPIKNRFTSLLPNSSTFQGAFLEKDTGNGVQYFKVQFNANCIKCISWKDGVSPKKLEKKYDSSVKAEDATRKYISDLIKKGFSENAEKFKFDYYYTGCSLNEPELEIDILDSPETEDSFKETLLENSRKTPKRRFSVEDALKSVGLERFTSLFDNENIRIVEFMKLNERDLEKLNLPPSARRKILNSIVDGKWRPVEEYSHEITKKFKVK